MAVSCPWKEGKMNYLMSDGGTIGKPSRKNINLTTLSLDKLQMEFNCET